MLTSTRDRRAEHPSYASLRTDELQAAAPARPATIVDAYMQAMRDLDTARKRFTGWSIVVDGERERLDDARRALVRAGATQPQPKAT